jgi:hypothetical protein
MKKESRYAAYFIKIRLYRIAFTNCIVSQPYSEFVVGIMFGKEYLSISLLWKYALAISPLLLLIFLLITICP